MRLLQAKIVDDDSSSAWASFIELVRKSKEERIVDPASVEKGVAAWEEWRHRRVVVLIDDPPPLRARNANDILLEQVVVGGGCNTKSFLAWKEVLARASRMAASDDDMVC